MTTEDMESSALRNGADEHKRTKKQKKKKKKTDGEERQEDGSLQTDLKRTKKKMSKKRAPSDFDSRDETCVNAEAIHEEDGEYDMNEPTMEEKLASLDLVVENKSTSTTNQELSPVFTPPSADSVHLLLKQALHADDHALLLDCLYSREDKVISKSISLLNPSDALKLLKSLTPMIQQRIYSSGNVLAVYRSLDSWTRGAVLVCALPWLRSLLSQHASSIASQESSLLLLNSLYQLIDSRISTFQSALQLSTCLDVLSVRIPDNEADEESTEPAIVYEVEDSDEEEEEEDEVAMETDGDDEDMGAIIGAPDSDGSEVTSD